MARRDKDARRAYGLRRLTVAVDRLIVTKSAMAALWARRWAVVAGVAQPLGSGRGLKSLRVRM
jgi:hypothetical protein